MPSMLPRQSAPCSFWLPRVFCVRAVPAEQPTATGASAGLVDPQKKAYSEQLTRVADPMCDEAVADVFQRKQGAAVNEALRG